jgi:hypothetical protein
LDVHGFLCAQASGKFPFGSLINLGSLVIEDLR